MARRIRSAAFFLVVAFVLAEGAPLAPPAFAQACGCKVSKSKLASYDALLILDADEILAAEERHLPWGLPKSPSTATNDHVLAQEEYVIGYDDDLRVPLWVAERLRDSDVVMSRKRTECFRRDPRLDDASAATCEDYAGSGFDRGHQVPNADMKRSEAAMINTYILSNMAPQYPEFNRKIWAWLEGYVRDWATATGEVYVISGAVFDRDGNGKRDADSAAEQIHHRVAIPTHFYKIILHQRPNHFIETMTILLPHENASPAKVQAEAFLTQHLTNIDAIESLTGLDFLPELEAKQQKAVEHFTADHLWPRE